MALKNKRYFWIQLAQDFFKSKEMKLLRKIAGGDTHTIIYLKMMLISLEDGGHIYYDGLADNLAEEIALVIDENVEDIKITLIFLESKGLLTRKNDRDYFLEQVPEMVGSETATARRVRKFRENKQALQCNTDETKCNGDIDIEKDIEKDIDIEKESNKTMVSSSLFENLKHSGIRINNKQHQQLLEYVGLDGMSFDMLNRAIEITSEVYQPSFKYLRGVLENWKKKGFTTIEQVDENDQKYKEGKNYSRPGQQNDKTSEQEVRDEWGF
ncbi:TPA: phage replisome organizer N-terminal domain-containing protein [Streptococcus pneumoniae]|nr:phage replisome organizer N-terminal domain-containing protein [Streptococcus pneumoniae]